MKNRDELKPIAVEEYEQYYQYTNVFLDAVDTVCEYCSFTEEQCNNCPVRIHTKMYADRQLPIPQSVKQKK